MKIGRSSGEKDTLDIGIIRRTFPEKEFVYLSATGSTQDEAKRLASLGKKEGAVVIAETQEQGRGRFFRKWSSGKGGLWFSVIFFPGAEPEKIIQLSLAAAVSLSKTLERTLKIEPRIKWPNDILVKGKKIAGILSETSFTSGKLDRAIVGIGLNVNNILPKKLKTGASSLKELFNGRVDRTLLLKQILADLYSSYEKFKALGFGSIREDFSDRSVLHDTRVELEEGERIYRGIAEGIDETGYLILRTDQGLHKKITAGTVLKYG